MDSKRKAFVALLLSINLVFCALNVHATYTPSYNPSPPSNNPSPPSNNPTPPPNNPSPPSNNPSPPSNNPTPPPNNPSPPPNNPSLPPNNPTPPSNNPSPPPNNPSPPPNNTPPPPNNGTCPRDALQLGICANVLGSLLGIIIGNPPVQPCCSLIQGLADLEAAICLCTAIRANLLGINLNIPLSISLLINVCGGNTPSGFICN